MLDAGLLLDSLIDDTVDVCVTLVGDDALGIVIHLVLAVGDMLADVVQHILAKVQLSLNLVVALEQLNGVPTQEAVIDLALDGLLDVCDGVLHTAGKDVGQLTGLLLLGSGCP